MKTRIVRTDDRGVGISIVERSGRYAVVRFDRHRIHVFDIRWNPDGVARFGNYGPATDAGIDYVVVRWLSRSAAYRRFRKIVQLFDWMDELDIQPATVGC